MLRLSGERFGFRVDRGRPLLILGPSLGTSARGLWAAVAPELGRHFDVLAWDLPGHGDSPATVQGFGVHDLAESVLTLADAALRERGEPGGGFCYAGISVGGAVGLDLAANHPERLSAATLICTGAKIGTPEYWRERAELVRAQGIDAVVDTSPGRWFAPGFATRDPAAVARAQDTLRAVDAGSYAFVCEALGAHDLRERLAGITTPILAVAGEHDQPTPPQLLRQIAETVRDGQLVVLADAAHLPAIEQPMQIADLIISHAGTGAAAGMRVRREVLGDAHVDRALASASPFTADFGEFITQYVWGGIWTRPGLDRRMRSAVVLTALVAGQHVDELALHVRGARSNGLSADEIKEVLMQAGVYCGIPAANLAFRIADVVLAELDGRSSDDDGARGDVR